MHTHKIKTFTVRVWPYDACAGQTLLSEETRATLRRLRRWYWFFLVNIEIGERKVPYSHKNSKTLERC